MEPMTIKLLVIVFAAIAGIYATGRLCKGVFRAAVSEIPEKTLQKASEALESAISELSTDESVKGFLQEGADQLMGRARRSAQNEGSSG